MIDVLDTIKQAYDRSTTQVDKIILNGKEYRISNVEYYDDTYLDGNIFGTAIGKNIDFEIQNTIDLEGQEIEYLTGITVDGTTQWISLGNFIIQDVQPNNTTNIAKVTATDYMLKTNIPYVSDLDYESGKVTLLNVLQEVCTKSGLTLATTSFTNSTFIVDSNQFTEETLNRQVIQAVAQVSGTVAKIRNNQLYLINPNQIKTVSKVFTLNNYKEAEIKRATHPINLVSLGMADIEGENITLRDETSITENGENSLVINDNPFAYAQAKREQLITALFDAVKGFEYKSYSFKNCQGLPYLETLDKIQFKDKEGNTYDSFIFRFNNKSPNGLESTIEAPSITRATVAYQNVPSALDISKRTEIKVDKQNQTIQAVIEETNELQSQVTDITTTQATIEGTEIRIDDGAEEPIIKLEVDGASSQDGTPTPDAPVEIQSVGDDENLFDSNLFNSFTQSLQYVEVQLKPNTTYTMSSNIKKSTGGYYNLFAYKKGDSASSEINGVGEEHSYTFTTGDDGIGVIAYRDESLDYSNPILEFWYKLQEGNITTAYSEYGKGTVEIKQVNEDSSITNNYVIPLSTPLRSLPNGVKDTIEEDGIHRRVGSATVNIHTITTLSNGNIGGISNLTNKIANYEENVICSKAVAIRSFEENTVYINISNSVFVGNPTDTLETIKEKFDGAEIIYELAEEVIEPFDEEQQAVIDSIETNLYTQYLTCDANMRITYVRNNGLSDMYETKQSSRKKSAQLQIQIDEINAKVESVEDLTVGKSGTKTITLDNCAKGSLLKLQIKGNNEVFKYLYPSDSLYPSNTLYPYGDSRIKVTNSEGEKIYELGVMDVLRVNGNVYDEYILENGIAKVIRRINTDGTVKTTPTEENIGEYSIDLAEGINTIEIVNYSATMNVLYAIKSNFTEIFATKAEVKSEISQKADEVNMGVDKRLENYSTTTQMNSAINVKAEEVTTAVSKTYETKDGTDKKIEEAKGEIKVTTDNISLEVGKKVNNEDYTSANILLKINNDTSETKIKSDKISLERKRI